MRDPSAMHPSGAAESEPSAARADVESQSAARALVTKRGLVYRFIVSSVRILYSLYMGLRVRGREHLREHTRAVIVANHASFLDIPLIAVAASPQHVAFMARATLADTSWLAWVMRCCGAILVERGTSDRAALRSCAEHLEAEDLVAIFPEGTRTPTGALGPFRKGAALAARMGKAPIVPCAIHGTYESLSRHARFPRRHRLEVEFFPALDSAAPDAMDRARATIEAALAERAPPETEAAR